MSASSADSIARQRERAASSLTTADVDPNTASANQFRESVRVNVYSGGRKKKLNASIDTTDAARPNASPHPIAIGSTAKT